MLAVLLLGVVLTNEVSGSSFFGRSVFAQSTAQPDYERLPVSYSKSKPSDRVQTLIELLHRGAAELTWDPDRGWLPSLLKLLEVPRSSQLLVFSKTSMQFRRITPARPRALYFSDDVYVGWVRGGDFLEIAAVDSELGAVFYRLDQQRTERPKIERDGGACLTCHATEKTRQVPGFLVRSVYPQPDGQPDYKQGTVTTDHSTPFDQRFGGWYVTGAAGDMRHRGNVVLSGKSKGSLDREAGANLETPPAAVPVDAYLESTSDIVALMLLEHQTQFHNLVTHASYTARQALHQQQEMNRILDRPADYRSESTVRRINGAAEQLVRYLLFCAEPTLPSPVVGSAKFAAAFLSSAVRDSKGRSLRDFDLKRRLFRFPCSYLIYTKSFQSLPDVILQRVKTRLTAILTGADRSPEFSALSAADRQHVLEILRETHPLFRSDTGVPKPGR